MVTFTICLTLSCTINLETTFSDVLGFTVTTEINLTKTKMETEFKKFSKEDHAEADMTAVVVMMR